MKIELKIETADPLHAQIRRQLEQMIRNGALTEGQRLPSTIELMKHWGVTCAAVQKAMGSLSASGLIERKPGRGTFVRSSQDKAVIGLLVGPHLLDESAHFWRAIVRAIQRETGHQGWRSLCYDQMTYSDAENPAESERRLLHDIQCHRFKGLALVGCGRSAIKAELLRNDLPKVSLSVNAHETNVWVDSYDFTRAAVCHLAGQGRKRIVFLRPHPDDADCRVSAGNADGRAESGKHGVFATELDGFMDATAAHGIAADAGSIYQVKPIPDSRFGSVEQYGYSQMIRLIEQWKRARLKPDGLIVTDDILMRGVAQALNERGVQVPRQLAIVCATNEGMDHLYAVPVIRYQYPTEEIARQLAVILWKKIAGEPVSNLPVLLKGQILERASRASLTGPDAQTARKHP